MLSSIILSMAMSASPAPIADIHNLDIQEVGKARGARRLNADDDLNMEKTGKARGARRLSADDDLNVEKTGKARGARRL